jgi:hypothetical protein
MTSTAFPCLATPAARWEPPTTTAVISCFVLVGGGGGVNWGMLHATLSRAPRCTFCNNSGAVVMRKTPGKLHDTATRTHV